MASEGGNQDWAAMRALTHHANMRDVAVPERSGGTRTGAANRLLFGGQGANTVSGLAHPSPSFPGAGRRHPADNLCRVATAGERISRSA